MSHEGSRRLEGASGKSGQFLAKLDIPVCDVNEVLPAIVRMDGELDLDEWTPLRSLGLADEVHAGFLRSAVGLARVALDARAHDVFPSGRTATVARNDVVKVQIASLAAFAAILAGVLIPLEDVVPGEFDLLLRHAVIDQKQYHAWNANAEGNCADVLGCIWWQFLRKIAPFLEAQCAESSIVCVEHSLSVALEEQGQGPACRADVDSLPQPVENQHMVIKRGLHNRSALVASLTAAEPACQLC